MENGPTDANAPPLEAEHEDRQITRMQAGSQTTGDALHDLKPVVDGTAGLTAACIFLPDLSAETPFT